MTVNRSIYVGVYLKVYMPKEKYVAGMVCQRCSWSPRGEKAVYCTSCGSPLSSVEKERMKYFGHLLEEVFKDENRFSYVHPPKAYDYILVIGNTRGQSGYINIDDYECESEIPNNVADGDWQTLVTALSEHGIAFERKYGIVNYYS